MFCVAHVILVEGCRCSLVADPHVDGIRLGSKGGGCKPQLWLHIRQQLWQLTCQVAVLLLQGRTYTQQAWPVGKSVW